MRVFVSQNSWTHIYIVVLIIRINYCTSGRTLTGASAGNTRTLVNNSNNGNDNNNGNNNDMERRQHTGQEVRLTTILHSHRREIEAAMHLEK